MKVSIVTPSFNQGRFIRRTLESVGTQIGADVEHVVFDGGSTDNTIEVLKDFGDHVKWVSEPDKGQADAINKGICATNGDIIGWLNSDDIYYQHAIARVVEFFETNPDIDVVYGMADHVDITDHPFENYPTEPWDMARMRNTCIICQPAAFFRRCVVTQYGLLDETRHYCMDYEYWLRLGKAGVRFAYLEKKLAGSRLYAENKTWGSRLKVHAEINDMQRSLFEMVPDRWLWNYAHAVVDDHVDRDKSPRWFAMRLLIAVTKAAWRWNGRLSKEMKADLMHFRVRLRNRTTQH